MNINLKIKSFLVGALATAGLMAVSSPSVTVGEVSTGAPWSTVTVNYTLGGLDADLDYKVAFDVTANGVTRGVTNAAAKLAARPVLTSDTDELSIDRSNRVFRAETPRSEVLLVSSGRAAAKSFSVELLDEGAASVSLHALDDAAHQKDGALFGQALFDLIFKRFGSKTGKTARIHVKRTVFKTFLTNCCTYSCRCSNTLHNSRHVVVLLVVL